MKPQFILLISVIFTLHSCEQPKTDNDTRLLTEYDNNNCIISSLVIPEEKSNTTKIKPYNKPIAITFFTLNKLLEKYDGVNQDSLPPILKKPGRQEIYKIYDVNGIYYTAIQPKLDSMSITIIDAADTKGLLAFVVENKLYHINKERYKEMDGVLFYNGKDKPIFWTQGIECMPEFILESYYKNKTLH
jgi:hypothetical protein